MKYLLATLVLLILAGAGFFYRQKIMSFFSKSLQYEILETRDFQCDGMKGFTFKYPVFKGWEVSEIRKMDSNECSVFLNWPEEFQIDSSIKNKSLMEPAPQIKVVKDQPHVAMQENPNGVRYEKLTNYEYFFNLSSFSLTIELININERFGFSKDLFWQQVIESFKVEDPKGFNNL